MKIDWEKQHTDNILRYPCIWFWR